MLLQLSAFSIHGTKIPMDEALQSHGFLRRYEIPAAAKPTIRRELRQIGVRRSTIFPDLENLAAEQSGAPYS